MKRSTLFLPLAAGLFVVATLLKFALPDNTFIPSGDNSSSSSLNLIVRVSPSLNKEHMPSSSGSSIFSSLYQPYSPETDLQGKSTLLFFWKSDDPFSDSHEIVIRDAAASKIVLLPVYRIDFETSDSMKLRYGVILPDTFVLLDTAGQKVQFVLHPTDTELQSLLMTPR